MFKSQINKLNEQINNPQTHVVTEQAKSNLKNGYIAVAATFVMTLFGFILGSQVLGHFLGITHSGAAHGAGGMGWGFLIFMLIGFGLIFAIQACANSVWGLVLLMVFGLVEGIFLTPLILSVSEHAILGALAGTVVLALSTSFVAIRGYETNKVDSSQWGGYLIATLLGLFVAMIINIFLQSTGFQMLISCGMIVIMSGFMIYDTQQAIKNPRESYILVALSFYLNIINIFINLLILFGIGGDN